MQRSPEREEGTEALGRETPRRDERALRRQLERYAVRFNDAFWRFWDDAVAPGLPPRPVVVDVGPGPGLFLRDLSARLPDAALHGLDANEAMIENAAALDYAGPVPSLRLLNAEAEPLPFADGAVDLLTMTAVLHMFADPFAFLRDQAARVIGSNGRLLVYDWFRVPMRDYLERRMIEPGEPEETRYQRALEQFRSHNKYTLDDWRWLFAETGMRVESETSASHPFARAWVLRAE